MSTKLKICDWIISSSCVEDEKNVQHEVKKKLHILVSLNNAWLTSHSFFSSSGLTHEGHARDVEQVYLRCSQGSLEWLYPTGAIIVNLRPNMVSPAAARLFVCIKPSSDSRGTNIYLDRNGKLRLLLREDEQAQGKVQCFSIQEGALFIEAVPHMDISRRITAFQYELVSERLGLEAQSLSGKMHPCLICLQERMGHEPVGLWEKYSRLAFLSYPWGLAGFMLCPCGVWSGLNAAIYWWKI